MVLAQITDHVDQALSLLQSALSGPVLRAVLGVFVQAVQDYEDLVFGVLQQRQFGTATGVQLDDIGQLLGLARSSDSDFAYTFHIAAAIIANIGGGTGDALLTIADRVLTGLPGSVEITEDPELSGGDTDAVVTWATDNEVDPAAVEARNVINRLLARAVVAGVSTTKQPIIPAIRDFATLPEAIALTVPSDQFRLTGGPQPGGWGIADETMTGLPANAHAIACDGQRIYVAADNRVIAMRNAPGAQVPVFQSRANMVESTTAKIDTDGAIVVAGELTNARTYSCFGVYDRNTGAVLFRDTTLVEATDVLADSDGTVKRAYLASGNTLYRWQSSDPATLEAWVSAPSGTIRAITSTATDVWALWNDGANSSIHRIAKTATSWNATAEQSYSGNTMEAARLTSDGTSITVFFKNPSNLEARLNTVGGVTIVAGQWVVGEEIATRRALVDDRYVYVFTGSDLSMRTPGNASATDSTSVGAVQGMAIDGLYVWTSDGTTTLTARPTLRNENDVWQRVSEAVPFGSARTPFYHLAVPT